MSQQTGDGLGRMHTRFVAVARVSRTDCAVDTNLRKLRVMRWVDRADVRAWKTARPSILTAGVVETGTGPWFPAVQFTWLVQFPQARGVTDTATDASFTPHVSERSPRR
jgi:hypothetical protein